MEWLSRVEDWSESGVHEMGIVEELQLLIMRRSQLWFWEWVDMVVIIQNVGKIVEGPDVERMTRGFILDALIFWCICYKHQGWYKPGILGEVLNSGLNNLQIAFEAMAFGWAHINLLLLNEFK